MNLVKSVLSQEKEKNRNWGVLVLAFLSLSIASSSVFAGVEKKGCCGGRPKIGEHASLVVCHDQDLQRGTSPISSLTYGTFQPQPQPQTFATVEEVKDKFRVLNLEDLVNDQASKIQQENTYSVRQSEDKVSSNSSTPEKTSHSEAEITSHSEENLKVKGKQPLSFDELVNYHRD